MEYTHNIDFSPHDDEEEELHGYFDIHVPNKQMTDVSISPAVTCDVHADSSSEVEHGQASGDQCASLVEEPTNSDLASYAPAITDNGDVHQNESALMYPNTLVLTNSVTDIQE